MSTINTATAKFNPQRVLSFDLETTSANPFTAKIVTSALVRIDENGAKPYEMLADPGVEIPEEATKVHGITTEMARENGRPHEEVLKETVDTIYRAWDEGLTLIVFNAAYDLTVLRQLTGDFLVKGPVYDPFVMDKALDRWRKGSRRLSDMCDYYGVKIENAHEATSDALAAARVAWMQAKKRFVSDIDELSLDQLMEFQAVQYYEFQTSFAQYRQGRGQDASDINTSWPMQTKRT